jgi:hypothetical protein
VRPSVESSGNIKSFNFKFKTFGGSFGGTWFADLVHLGASQCERKITRNPFE